VEEKSKFLPALLQEIVVIVFFLVVIFSVYFTKNGITNIPFDVQVFDINNLEISEYKNQLMQTTIQTRSYVNTIPTAMSTDNISYEVTFVVYLIAYFGWIGIFYFHFIFIFILNEFCFILFCNNNIVVDHRFIFLHLIYYCLILIFFILLILIFIFFI
jgi:hypothetical protein